MSFQKALTKHIKFPLYFSIIYLVCQTFKAMIHVFKGSFYSMGDQTLWMYQFHQNGMVEPMYDFAVLSRIYGFAKWERQMQWLFIILHVTKLQKPALLSLHMHMRPLHCTIHVRINWLHVVVLFCAALSLSPKQSYVQMLLFTYIAPYGTRRLFMVRCRPCIFGKILQACHLSVPSTCHLPSVIVL